MKYLALLLALTMPVFAWSQVGIGTSSPDASAALELSATTKGFLPPRMTAAQRTAIGTPATGLMVYQTDGTTGLYVYSGSKWLHQASWYSIGTSSFMPSIPPSATTGALLNLGIGSSALNSVSTGDQNTAVGAQALQSLTATSYNTAVGYNSLFSTVSSSSLEAQFNTAIGRQSGMNNIKGSYNTFLGAGSDASLTNLSNATAIGNGAEVTASNTIQLGNGSVTNVNTSGTITTSGSVGIGTTSLNSAAALEIVSTTKGLLLPRLTTVQRDAIGASPPAGLLIFNTTDNLVQTYNGIAWVNLH
jgi:hypothetical protein